MKLLPADFRILIMKNIYLHMMVLPTKQKLEFLSLTKNLPKELHAEIQKNKAKETMNVLFDTIKPRMEFTKIFMALSNE